MKTTALKIAVRDLRASWTKFAFVVLAVAAGVGALTGVRGFSEAFRSTLMKEVRALTGADISVRLFAQPTEAQQAALDSLVKRGAIYTQALEMLSMAGSSNAPVPLLTSIKVVDPALYPLYGELKLDPAGKLRDLLHADTVVVAGDLLLRLNVKVGDIVSLGGQSFRIAAVIVAEPDRMSGGMGVGPRLMMTVEGVHRAGLMRLGTRASRRMLFKLPPSGPQVGTAVAELKQAFPEALITEYREINPNVWREVDRAATFLSLVSLIALVIGAIGVATAMRAHLQMRMDTIAVMKSIGGRNAQVIRIYLLQTLMLGAAGGILGIALGTVAQNFLPSLVRKFLQVEMQPAFSAVAALQGFVVGLLITVAFTLSPLLGVRSIRPAAILRREMQESRPGIAVRLRHLFVGVAGAIALTVLTIPLVASNWRDAVQIGSLFAGGLAASLLVLAGTSWALLTFVRVLVQRLPGMPVTLRHALANLYRPGSQSRSVLVALGVGVMFTFTVHLVQTNVLKEIRRNTPPGMSNVFFLEIAADQSQEFMKLLATQQALEREPEMVSNVACRLVAVNGVNADNLQLPDWARRRYRMARGITAETQRPAGVNIVRGAWWISGGPPQISVSESAARALKVEPGSTITWLAYGRTIETRVASIHRTDMQRLRAMVEFHVNAEALQGLPAAYYASARIRPQSVGALQKAVFERFPTVTVINIADVLDRMQEVVDQIAGVIRFISGFAMFAGAVILASSVAATRFRRVREMALFKTLGATRKRIALMLSAEFLLLGLVAGVIGSLLANAFTWIALRRFFKEVAFQPDPWALVVSVCATAAIASAAGWLASFRLLGQKPLEVLRGE